MTNPEGSSDFAAGVATATAEQAAATAAEAELTAEAAGELAEAALDRADAADNAAWDAKIEVEMLREQVAELRELVTAKEVPAAGDTGTEMPAPEVKAEPADASVKDDKGGDEPKKKRSGYGSNSWFGK